mgnify:CR=1 FL=1
MFAFPFGGSSIEVFETAGNSESSNKISSKFEKTAICTEGEGTCPPEDCGGPWAFMEMKEVLKKPESEECKLMLKWLNLKKCEDWNLNYFDKELVNKFIEELNLEEKKSEIIKIEE